MFQTSAEQTAFFRTLWKSLCKMLHPSLFIIRKPYQKLPKFLIGSQEHTQTRRCCAVGCIIMPRDQTPLPQWLAACSQVEGEINKMTAFHNVITMLFPPRGMSQLVFEGWSPWSQGLACLFQMVQMSGLQASTSYEFIACYGKVLNHAN